MLILELRGLKSAKGECMQGMILANKSTVANHTVGIKETCSTHLYISNSTQEKQ